MEARGAVIFRTTSLKNCKPKLATSSSFRTEFTALRITHGYLNDLPRLDPDPVVFCTVSRCVLAALRAGLPGLTSTSCICSRVLSCTDIWKALGVLSLGDLSEISQGKNIPAHCILGIVYCPNWHKWLSGEAKRVIKILDNEQKHFIVSFQILSTRLCLDQIR